MKEENAPSLKKPIVFFLSFFGSGLMPIAPGTWGSLLATITLIPLELLSIPWVLLMPFTIILVAASSFLIDMFQKEEGIHDPGWIVIDEVVGIYLTWMICPKFEPYLTLVLTFLFFRLFDIIKPWPIKLFDQKIHNGFGVMIDDVAAALYAGASCQACAYLFL